MAENDERVVLMEDINAWVEQALIRQYRAAYAEELPSMTPEERARVNTDASTFASGWMADRDCGYGLFNLPRAFKRGQADGHYRLGRAISRTKAAALGALCGSNGRYRSG